MRINDILVEFAPSGGGGGSGDYFQALASAWYNGTFDTGSLQKGIKSQQDVEQLLQRGIIGPDGVTRKYGIDYNSTFDGVEIYSDDYYEYGDHDDTIDSRTGQKWGPYDFMAFSDDQLDESAKYRDAKYKDQLYTQEPPDYMDTREYDRAMFDPKPDNYPGRKELPGGGEYDRTDPLVRGAGIGRSGIKNNILDRGKRKGLPSRDQITSLKQSIRDISGRHTRANLPKESVNEFAADDGDSGGEDDALHKYARMWWGGDEATQMQIEKVLARMGWEIGEDEGGYDNGGVFVVRAGDINGDSYESWAAEDLTEQGVAEGSLNEFAPDGFNGDDDEGFSPEIAKMAQEHGFTKGVSLADGATLEMAMKINHWHTQHGGMYKQYFANGFKAGRMNKVNHDNKQYNLNLKLMKDGSIRHGEQGMAEGSLEEDEYDKMLRDLLKARPDLTKKYAKDVQKSKDIESGKELNKLVKKNPGVLKTYSDAVKRDKKSGMAEDDLNEKSTSQAQFRTMAAAAHDPKFARKVGIKPSVAKEFNRADKGQDYKDLPKKATEGAPVTTTPGSIEPGGAVDNFKQQMANNTERDMAEGNRKPEPPEADYGDDYQDMVKRVKRLAGLGPLKTQYDPNRRVYRNMPTAVQPKK